MDGHAVKNCEIDDDAPTCTLSVELSREERVREYRRCHLIEIVHLKELVHYFINGTKDPGVLWLNYNESMTYHIKHDESRVSVEAVGVTVI